MHLDHLPLLLGALLGAVLSIVGAELVQRAVPSAELRELRQLGEAIEPVLTLARENSPTGSDAQALELLADEVRELREVSHQVRSLEVEASLEIYGNWATGSPLSSPGVLYFSEHAPSHLDFELKSGAIKRVRLYNVGMPSLVASGTNQTKLTYRAAARPGDWPVGSSSEAIVALVAGRLTLFGVGTDSFVDDRVGIRNLELAVFINSLRRAEISESALDGVITMSKGPYTSMPLDFQFRVRLNDAS